MRPVTVGGWVAQNFLHVLVGGVLAQSAHNVGHLVVGHLAVTNSVKETKSLLEVWRDKNKKRSLSYTVLTQVAMKNLFAYYSSSDPVWVSFVCDRCVGSLN